MKIAIFTGALFCNPEFKDAISGHAQIPLMTSKILVEAGNQVTVITTKPMQDYILPDVFPNSASLKVVQHSHRPWPTSGVYPLKAMRQFSQMFAIFSRESFDIIHFFGSNGIGLLLGCLKRLGIIKSRAFFSPIKRPHIPNNRALRMLLNYLFRAIDTIAATSEYVARGWDFYQKERVAVLRPGVMKDLYLFPYTKTARNSVLFWRNANARNGADLALNAFRHLAKRYPSIQFVFAVRPNDALEQDLLKLELATPNVRVHLYPYKSEVSLASLLQEAICVVLPFRVLSINPQISVLETLYAGVPLITTDIESNPELVRNTESGILIRPKSRTALIEAVKQLLQNRDLCERIANRARVVTRSRWNWETFKKQLNEIYAET